MPNRTVIARILRVDHGGEHGAIQIYSRQIQIARWRCPELLPRLIETLGHERSHKERFRALMPDRDAKPCRMMWVWGVGGAVLGALTGLLGARAVYACTDAVERTVHRHLADQMRHAESVDDQLHAALIVIDAEEREHLDWAAQGLGERRTLDRILHAAIGAATELLIWISTRGDSSRLAKELRQASPSIA
jgi:ubiquinone biosynthesis monooxygenase Coq7